MGFLEIELICNPNYPKNVNLCKTRVSTIEPLVKECVQNENQFSNSNANHINKQSN